MLSLLHIENVAVVEEAEIRFFPGFNVLTGETGAGKSIVIDAINAVLGGRISRDLVRTGAQQALVTAVFDGVPNLPWFGENDIEQEDELYLQRRVTADGKGSARVNGKPVSAGQLKSLGEVLLNIHGQHDGQELMQEATHLHYLDSFGGAQGAALLGNYATVYAEFEAKKREYLSLQMDESEKARRLDMLKHQVEELEGANLQVGEEAALRERRSLLANAEKLETAAAGAYDALYGGDEIGEGAQSLLGQAEGQVSYAAGVSELFLPLAQQLESLRYGLEDAVAQLRDIRENLEFSPQELDEIEDRLSLLSRLGRKYGSREEEMLAFLEQSRQELDSLHFSADREEKLKAQLEGLEQKVINAGQALSQARKTAGEALKVQVEDQLKDLSMKGAQFSVEIEAQAPDETGMDAVGFLLSANAGEKLGKLSKIASGGELARIMLALKTVLSESEAIGTMVFDEVDTGVSGIAAQRVGEKLSDLAQKKQVICVTHLPQIAALADAHYLILKSEQAGRTYTQVTQLEEQGQERELARLIGGENITDATLQAAKDQRRAAKGYKKG